MRPNNSFIQLHPPASADMPSSPAVSLRSSLEEQARPNADLRAELTLGLSLIFNLSHSNIGTITLPYMGYAMCPLQSERTSTELPDEFGRVPASCPMPSSIKQSRRICRDGAITATCCWAIPVTWPPLLREVVYERFVLRVSLTFAWSLGYLGT